MTLRLRSNQLVAVLRRSVGWFKSFFAPSVLHRRTFRIAFVTSVFAVIYWGLIASDRYVSEARVVIQRTDLSSSQTMDFSSLLSGVSTNNQSDQLLLRDHLLSVDMLQKLDAALNLRAHFSDERRDILSRMWSDELPLELFHRYFRSRVDIEFDEYAGVLVVRAQAYEPDMAFRIASLLVDEGERYMNTMAHRLAEEQVSFLEKQVEEMSKQALEARQILIEYQNKTGMASPQGTAENVEGIINRLEGQLADLQTKRSAMLGYLMPDSASSVEINLQISAIQKQLAQERKRLASTSDHALNQAVEEYQRLQLNADFAQDMYKSALVALEKGRIEATRTLKKVSVLQSPTQPQYPLEPRRLYNIIVFILIALILAGVMHLIAAIIRDHKD